MIDAPITNRGDVETAVKRVAFREAANFIEAHIETFCQGDSKDGTHASGYKMGMERALWVVRELVKDGGINLIQPSDATRSTTESTPPQHVNGDQ